MTNARTWYMQYCKLLVRIKITATLIFTRFHLVLIINHFNESVQERCNSIANALELRLSCTNPSICDMDPSDSLSTNANCHLTIVTHDNNHNNDWYGHDIPLPVSTSIRCNWCTRMMSKNAYSNQLAPQNAKINISHLYPIQFNYNGHLIEFDSPYE